MKEKGMKICVVAPVASHLEHFLHTVAMKDNIVIVSPEEVRRSHFDPEPILIKNYRLEEPERGWNVVLKNTNDVKSHYQNRANRRKKKKA